MKRRPQGQEKACGMCLNGEADFYKARNLQEVSIAVKKNMVLVTLAVLTGLLASGAAYCLTKNQALYTIAIAFGTTFYHLAMRLAAAYIINTKFHNRMDYTKSWFQEKGFEAKFYKAIGVKKWKKWLPTFHPKDFVLEKRSAADITGATCQAEIVHEVIMVLSFVPVIFSVCFGAVWVFLITSCMAFVFDGIFVMIQRYNRPRLMRLMK